MHMELWWVYDVVVIALLVGCMVSGIKQGFAKVVITTCGMILAYVLSIYFSGTISENIYNKYFKENIISKTENVVADFSIQDEISNYIARNHSGVTIPDNTITKIIQNSRNNMDSDIYNYLNAQGVETSVDEVTQSITEGFSNSFTKAMNTELPLFVTNGIDGYMDNNKPALFQTIRVLTSDKSEAAKYLETNFFRKPIIMVIRIIAFVILWVIIMIAVKILVYLADFASRATVSENLDKVLGAILGLGKGFIIILLIAIVLRSVITFTGQTTGFFSNSTIEDTIIFHYFYEINVIE